MPATILRLNLTSQALLATALDSAGVLLADASRPVETLSPEPGWLEQRPDDWWAACISAIADLRKQTSLATVTQVTVTSEFAASVFLDGGREVIRPAILEGDIRGPHPLLWLRTHQAIAYKRVQHLLQPADYLRLMLTGEIETIPADAERTGLLDVESGAWDARRCDELEVNVELLPAIRRNAVPILDVVAATLGVPSVAIVV